MGLLDNQTEQGYYSGDNFGKYQFTSLNDIINQFMFAYVGEDKIISKVKRTEVAFHAQRAMQELSFDTFKSCKSQEIEVSPSLTMVLPQDYVNYTNVTWVDDLGVEHPLYPTKHTSNPQKILQNEDGSYYSNLIVNGDFNNNINGWQFWNVATGTSASGGFNETQVNWSVDSDGVLLTTNGLGDNDEPKFQQQILFEDGVEYTFSYNITSISSNIATTDPAKILIYSSDDDTYKPVEISLTSTSTGTNSTTFIWDAESAGTTPPAGAAIVPNFTGWGTIQLSAGDSLEKSISIKDITLLKNKNDGGYELVQNGTINSEDESTTWSNYRSNTPSENKRYNYENDPYWSLNDKRYGLNPANAQANGSFFIDCNKGLIHFSSNVSGKTVILKYISDGLGTDEEMKVHKFAEEAMYKWLLHAVTSTRRNIQEYVIARYRKEKIAAVRKAKLRLSNIKLEEITQILRGKSKWIKH